MSPEVEQFSFWLKIALETLREAEEGWQGRQAGVAKEERPLRSSLQMKIIRWLPPSFINASIRVGIKPDNVALEISHPKIQKWYFYKAHGVMETAHAPFHISLSRMPKTLSQLASFWKAEGKIKGNWLISFEKWLL